MSTTTTILLVGDGPHIVTAGKLLSKAGYLVVEERTAAAALQLAADQHYALVLMDAVLPDMDGVDFCQALRAVPLVQDSLYVMFADSETPVDCASAEAIAGPDDTIIRPVAHHEFLARIEIYVRLQRRLAERTARLRSELAGRQQQLRALQTQTQDLHATRQRAEEALRESEARSAKAQHIANIGDWEWNVATGEVFWSAEVYRIFAVPLQKPSYDLARSLVHPSDRAFWENSVQATLRDGAPFRIDYRALCPDGVLRWVHNEAEVIRDGEGTPLRMIGTVQDVTERKQAEEALRKSERDLLRAQRIGHLGSWEWDLVDQTLTWSDELYQIWGIGPDFVLTFESIEAMIHPEDQEGNAREVANLLVEGGQGTFEFRIVRPDHEIRYIRQSIEVERDPTGRVVRMFGIMQDVTERAKWQAQLAQQEQFVQAVADTVPYMLYVFDLVKQRNVYINRYTARFFGLSLAQMQQAGSAYLLEAMHPDDLQAWDTFAVQWPTAHDGEIFEQEYRLRNGDGAYRWMRSHETVFTRAADGTVAQILGTAADVTERKLAEVQREAALASLRQAMGRTTRSHRMISALSQASEAVQRARSAEAVYQTIGEKIRGMGYRAAVFLTSAESRDLTVAYMSPVATQHTKSIELAGLPTVGCRFGPEPGGLFERVIAGGVALFSGEAADVAREAQPAIGGVLPRRLVSVIGANKLVVVPLKIKGQVFGVLVVAGTDLAEADTPAIEAFANQAGIALENLQSLELVRAGRERLRQLTRQIVSTQEEERKHVAQELHDELGQALTAVSFDLAAIEAALLPELSPDVRAHLAEARTLTDQLDERIGEMALDLRPAILDDLGLAPALGWFVKRYIERLGIAVTLEMTGIETRMPPEIETTLYRVAQEALTNISKHARATEVCITLRREGTAVTLSVEDNGQGFTPDDGPGWQISSRGVGLLGMQERVASVGGTFLVRSTAGQGTRVAIEIPL